MLKIKIVAVTYNSYLELNEYINSLDKAAQKAPFCKVSLGIVDNSDILQDYDIPNTSAINLEIKKFCNIGYFGGAFSINNNLPEKSSYDYIIISNVDIKVPMDFFIKLSSAKYPNDVAWIANSIWSEQEQRDKNPKILNRCSLNKLKLQRILYKYPILDYLYTNTLYKRKLARSECRQKEIYAGHGSFIILTKTYFEKYPQNHYPVFLFGEEIFLAERIRLAGLKVLYEPSLIVYDTEHTSTGKMKKSFYYKCNREAIEYILKTFYNE